MSALSIVLQSLLIAYFLFSGTSKVLGVKYWVDIFQEIKLPQWLRTITGVVQLIGAIGLIIGYWQDWLVAWSGLWLTINLFFAVLAHIRVKDSIGKTMPAITFFVLLAALVLIHTDYLFFPFS
ncbi:DoxX-like family protein [Seinonella peptonophila]|uniref:DoxX-like family protein n=1 Tax=Seinonella peptonophila TaxID=112248 RepID=A0A1M4X835_9BACL|nr:DoxX family protein [Seinonella peptonophila]SHE89626.1 DoxX-like family protein [Seinonella peptonophila]